MGVAVDMGVGPCVVSGAGREGKVTIGGNPVRNFCKDSY